MFVGLSQGGMVFMRLAYLHPEMVRGLVLLDTSAGPENPESLPLYEQLALAIRDGDDATRSGAVDAAQQVLYGATWRAAEPEGLAREKAMMLDHPRDGGYLAARAVFDRTTSASTWAGSPRRRSCSAATRTSRRRRSTPARWPTPSRTRGWRSIPGAGHHSAIENPAAVTAEIELFLAGLRD